MKLTYLIFSLLCYSLAFSQSETEIAAIKSQVEFTNTQYKNYTVVVLKNEEDKIEIYIDNSKNVKLICETYSNETGKTIIWDYIDNNHAYFILKEYYTYKLLPSNKNFNPSEFNKTDEGFYFKNDRIIRWMKDKKAVTKYPKNAATLENNIIEHIASLIEKYTEQTK